MSMIQAADSAAFKTAFPLKPFAIRHRFAGHPLFTLRSIVDLVHELPRDQIEYNSGKVDVGQSPDTTPIVDLDPEEVVSRIQTCGAWMVLKRVEVVPAYRALLEEALLSVAHGRGHATLEDAGFEDIRGFMFVSSPNSTTPFHVDGEDNFFVHLHGDKVFSVYDNRDGSIASDQAIEHSITKHRNVHYDPKFDVHATPFKLKAGDGVFVPYLWPHWVKTADDYSISLAITWKTKDTMRRNDIYTANSLLRSMGLPQAAPGKSPARDAVKLAVFRSGRAAAAPLRRSQGMRRLLRRLVLGRRANYFLNAGKKAEA